MGAINSPIETLEEIYTTLFNSLGIAELGIAGIVLLYTVIIGLISAVFGMLVSFLLFVLQSIPLYKISKKMGRKTVYLILLSWIPVIGGYISTYVLSDVPGNKPVKLTSKIIISNRLLSFWIYVGISIFGPALITAFVGIASLLPGFGLIIGSVSTMLYLVPTAATAWLEYVYLKDVLDIFNPDQKSNHVAALIVAILDSLVTFGFARAFYLYTVMNKEPLRFSSDEYDRVYSN